MLFNVAGAVIMASYAIERHESYHESYRKKYSSYPTARTPILPGLDLRPPAAVVKALGRG